MGVKEFFSPQIPAADDTSRFEVFEHQVGGLVFYVLTDRATGVSYLTKPGNDCPFTPLLEEGGLPASTKLNQK